MVVGWTVPRGRGMVRMPSYSTVPCLGESQLRAQRRAYRLCVSGPCLHAVLREGRTSYGVLMYVTLLLRCVTMCAVWWLAMRHGT